MAIENNSYQFKFLVAGDRDVGKATLLASHVRGRSFVADWPILYENIEVKHVFPKATVNVEFYQAGWESSRCVDRSYFQSCRRVRDIVVDAILLCFDVTSVDSFKSLLTVWNENIIRHCTGVLFVVGTKIDQKEKRVVSTAQGQQTALKLNASGYFEVSSLTLENVDETFYKAIETTLTSKKIQLWPDTPPIIPYDSPEILIEESRFFEETLIKFNNEPYVDSGDALIWNKGADVLFEFYRADRYIAAHRFVLCAISTVFRDALMTLVEKQQLLQEDYCNIQYQPSSGQSSIMKSVQFREKQEIVPSTSGLVVQVTVDEYKVGVNAFKLLLELIYLCNNGQYKEAQLRCNLQYWDQDKRKLLSDVTKLAQEFNLNNILEVCNEASRRIICIMQWNWAATTDSSVDLKTKRLLLDCLFPSDVRLCIKEIDPNGRSKRQKLVSGNAGLMTERCPAWKPMLSRSSGFKEAFMDTIEVAVDFEYGIESFEVVLDYLYHNGISSEQIDIDIILGVMKLADRFGLTRLVTLCEQRLVDSVIAQLSAATEKEEIKRVKRAIRLLTHAERCNAKQLVAFCCHFLSHKYQQVIVISPCDLLATCSLTPQIQGGGTKGFQTVINGATALYQKSSTNVVTF
eukprot:TRINITY_DN2357_c0_g1_i3.p1 TRINITY_DN2357_c0_g1~~TRINITY_DN2357_c0_g1_i3.p1  ORF type:complete len:630 (-),score=93.44 TRINITY_DN2357_c0_g1_i3:233-2122(-)